MKILLEKAFCTYSVLLDMSLDKELPFKVSYWCSKNIKNLQDDVDFYIKERNILFDRYLEKDEKGDIIFHFDNDGTTKGKIIEGYIEEFSNKLEELNSMPIEFEPYLIDLECLIEQKELKISARELSYIDFLIKE